MSAADGRAPVLRLRGLDAGHDGVEVVHGLDLTVGEGEVVAMLGANGAGKTTTLLTVSGLLPRLGGEVEVLGETVRHRRRPRVSDVWGMARRGVAHVPEDRGLFFDLSARENLLLGHRGRGAGAEIDRVLQWFPALERVLDRRCGLLSGGEQQMLALARAVVGRPRLMLVDELSLGLAPIVVEQILPVLRSIADETGMGMLVVEQHVALVLSIADRGCVMRRGRLVVADDAAALARDGHLVEAGYLGDG